MCIVFIGFEFSDDSHPSSVTGFFDHDRELLGTHLSFVHHTFTCDPCEPCVRVYCRSQ